MVSAGSAEPLICSRRRTALIAEQVSLLWNACAQRRQIGGEQSVFRKAIVAVMALGFLLAASSSALAEMSISAVGGPQPSRSWVHDFGISTDSSFTNFGMALTNLNYTPYFGLLDNGPPAIDFAQGGTAGWSETYFGPTSSGPGFIATAQGTATTELIWRSHFADPISRPFVMTVFAYSDIHTLSDFDFGTATWSGKSWSYNSYTGMSWIDFQQAVAGGAAPLPSAALLGVVGLFGVATIRRRLVDGR